MLGDYEQQQPAVGQVARGVREEGVFGALVFGIEVIGGFKRSTPKALLAIDVAKRSQARARSRTWAACSARSLCSSTPQVSTGTVPRSRSRPANWARASPAPQQGSRMRRVSALRERPLAP